MKPMTARSQAAPAGEAAERRDGFRRRIILEAAAEFGHGGWSLVMNEARRSIYGVAPGLYPDIVALDGTETGVAWMMEIASPETIAEEAAWERWHRIAATGHPFILAVPSGTGRAAEQLAGVLDVPLGLLYEYSFTPRGVAFTLPRTKAQRAPAD